MTTNEQRQRAPDPERVQRINSGAEPQAEHEQLPPSEAGFSHTGSEPPPNPTAQGLRQAGVQQLQRQLGNAHVARRFAQRQEAPAAPQAAPGAAPGTAATPAALIVDDATAAPQPGQMTKSAFLAQLRPAVEATMQAELSGTALLEPAREQANQQFARYSALDATALEQTIKREAPGAGGARQASDYIQPICARVRTTIAEQRATMPPGAEAASGLLSGVANAASSLANGAGQLLSGLGNLFFKAREGGARASDDPRAVQAQLGTGRALDGQVRSGLEAAFGQDFSGVRVHTDNDAASLSDQMNARAFTVGPNVAFASGEYQPGTPAGDALIAHEVAHVAQQRGASAGLGVQPKGAGDYDALEADADRSAVGAVLAMWNGAKGGMAQVGREALPRLQSGLRLQRCGKSSTPAVVPPTRGAVIPFDRAPLSAPGERILFNDTYDHATPSDFELQYAATGGTFDTATGAASKTVAGLASGNVSFFIGSAWDGTTPVSVTLAVRHRASGTVVLSDTWNFGKKPYFPTTITQNEGEGEVALGSVYTYKVGPDRGGDGADDYLHQTILETFGQRSCNITLAELKPEFRTAHPEITSPETITAHFFGTASNNGTFTVSAGDRIADRHGGGMPDKAVFEAALTTMKEIHVELPQTYEAEPGVALGRYLVRRILKLDGSKKLRKMRQP